MERFLAIDIGASSGRHIVGWRENGEVRMEEVYRFPNGVTEDRGHLVWDVEALEHHVRAGIEKAKAAYSDLVSLSIDTWGVDYGLLDRNGHLLGNPRAYRCAVDEDFEETWKIIDFPTLFARTGIANQNFNTVYQLYRRKREGDVALENAQTMLLLPDLLGYFLTGEKKSEYTEVTTTMLYNPTTKDWDWETIRELGLPEHIFTEIDRAGTLRGHLRPEEGQSLFLQAAHLRL